MSGIFAHAPVALAAAAPAGAAVVVAAGEVATVAGGAALVPRLEPALHAEANRTIATDRTTSFPRLSLARGMSLRIMAFLVLAASPCSWHPVIRILKAS